MAEALNRYVFRDETGIFGRLCLEAGRYSRKEEFFIPMQNAGVYDTADWMCEQRPI